MKTLIAILLVASGTATSMPARPVPEFLAAAQPAARRNILIDLDRGSRFLLWKIDDRGSLNAQSKGLDYVNADPRERARWAMRATVSMMEKAPQERVVVEAARLFACLNEMLTPKTEDEKIATGMLENNKLSELSALCATALHQGEN